MLGYNKNYVTLALKYVLKNSKGTLLALKINRKYKNSNIETD